MNSHTGGGTEFEAIPAREFTLNVSAVAVFIWLFKVIQFVTPVVRDPASLPLTTDDAMRLVQVRDLLAGQSWFDLTQRRMNAPLGLPMHWSRLVDAPIAGMIVLLRQFLSLSMAETLAVSLWPLVALLAAWLAIGRIAERLAGKKAGVIAILFGTAGSAVLGYFTPGSIDHHNVQVALTLWTVAFLVDFETRKSAATAAAITSALSLAIGLEVLPYVATTALAVAAFWIVRGERVASAVRRFGVTFALASLVILVGFTASHEQFSAACDSFSGFYAAFAMFGGLGLAALTFVSDRRPSSLQRSLLAAGLCLSLLVFAAVVAPTCLAGPYGSVSPRLDEIFLSRVEEVQSPVWGAARSWTFFVYGYVYSGIGLAACTLSIFLVAPDKKSSAIVVTGFAAMSFAVMSVEVRGVLFALLTSLPGLAASIQLLIERRIRPGWRAALATIAALVVFSNVTFVYAAFAARDLLQGPGPGAARENADHGSRYCFSQPSVAPLTKLPLGRVAALPDQGPAVLAYTNDAVLAGPYHRNEQGILDTFDLLTKNPAASAKIARRRDIDYVLLCRTNYDYAYYLDASGPDGLLGRLAANRVPEWLAPLYPVRNDNRVMIYRVLRSQLP